MMMEITGPDAQHFGGERHAGRPGRPLWPAIKRGLHCRCPHCGEGKLFRAFVKPVDKCEVCGEEIWHHRADDLPAYLVIVIVGHIVISAFMAVEMTTYWPMWLHLVVWAPLTLILSLLLLQPVKGGVIGLQWANYMHGFGGETDLIDTHPEAGA
jgi:uncharacterized protein (DUF983 family)